VTGVVTGADVVNVVGEAGAGASLAMITSSAAGVATGAGGVIGAGKGAGAGEGGWATILMGAGPGALATMLTGVGGGLNGMATGPSSPSYVTLAWNPWTESGCR